MSTTVTGIILIVGSAVVWAGSFLSINSRLYAQKDPQAQLAVVESAPAAWKTTNVIFALGALMVAVGMVAASRHLAEANAGIWHWLGLAAILLGILLFIWFLYQRTVTPSSYIHADGSKPLLLLVDMVIMTAALLAYGLAFRAGGLPGDAGPAGLRPERVHGGLGGAVARRRPRLPAPAGAGPPGTGRIRSAELSPDSS